MNIRERIEEARNPLVESDDIDPRAYSGLAALFDRTYREFRKVKGRTNSATWDKLTTSVKNQKGISIDDVANRCLTISAALRDDLKKVFGIR
jgi:phosphoribosylpyrophosphate synthetase